MKERPILFSTDMVKAILEGRKMQTRRVVELKDGDYFCTNHIVVGEVNGDKGIYYGFCSEQADYPCPYGQVGDRLWVREAFCALCPDDEGFCYKADREHNPASDLCAAEWKPSIFMPRWASRITLGITGVRVERLQEIAHEDAIAEGAEFMPAAKLREQRLTVPQIVFAGYWDTINKQAGYRWVDNPWCWVIEFKRLSL